MEEQRERARTGAEAATADRHEAVIAFASAPPGDPLRRLRDPARRRPASPPAAASSGARQARGEPVLRRGRRPGRRLGRAPLGRGRGRGRRRLPRRRRPGAARRGGGRAAAGRAGRGRGRPRRPPRDDAKPHRHAPAARRAARAPRHPRPPGGLGGAPRQAPLRLHPRRRARAPRSSRDIEDRVNDWIKESRPVRAIEMERAEAEALGAMALFGEKYGDWVRVVEVDDVSRELCGGTHVANTAEVGIFEIVSEGSSAANVRRIEALTGPAAIDWFRERSAAARRGRRPARLAARPGRAPPARGRAARRAREARGRGGPPRRRRGRRGARGSGGRTSAASRSSPLAAE